MINQIPPSALARLIVNCVKIYERKPKTLSKVFTFALSEEVIGNENINTEIRATRFNLDLLYLQQLFVINIETKNKIFEAIEKYSKISKNEIFEHMLVTLRVIKDQVSNPKDFAEKINHIFYILRVC